ncbi:MAG: glycosyltransferase [Pirellulales bacterium]
MHASPPIRLVDNSLRLSIVIPAVTSAAELEETLLSVLENRPEQCEVIVALACEYDDPWNLRDEVTFVRAPAGASTIGCVNLGISSASGEIVHVLSAGWKATPGWTDIPLERFADPDLAAVIPLTVSADNQERVVSMGMTYTRGGRRRVRVPSGSRANVTAIANAIASVNRPSRSQVVGPLIDAGFWRAEMLNAAGPGFAACCGESMADADLAVAIEAAGGVTILEPASLVVAGGTPTASSRFRDGLHAERLFWRSVSGQGLLPLLVSHLFVVLGHALISMPLGTVPMLAGRLIAAMQFGSYGSRYRQLRSLSEARHHTEAHQDERAQESPSVRSEAGEDELPRPRHLDRRGSLRRSA